MQKNSVFQGYLLEIFCWAKNKRNLCFAKRWSHEAWYLPLVLLFIILYNSFTVASLAQANKALNWPHASLFCRDTGSIRRRSIFFSGLFLYFFQKSKHLFKKNRAVEAAKSNRLSLRRVKIHLGRIRSKRCRSESWVFCIRYFSKTKRKSTKNITQRCFSCQNNSVCQKLARSYKKLKIGPKCLIRPFCMKPFNYERYISGTFQETIVQGIC